MLISRWLHHLHRNGSVYIFIALLSTLLVSFAAGHGRGLPLSAEPGALDTANATFTRVSCVSTVSGQWGLAPRVVFYLLLILTLLFRRNETLAALMVTPPMVYSSIAAIQVVLLYAVRNALGSPENIAPAHLKIGSSGKIFTAFYGVDDLDMHAIRIIVFTGLIAAIPIQIWSLTFATSPSRPVLNVWVLLLALAHPFGHLYRTSALEHYQMCPTGVSEPLPGRSYQALELNGAWRQRFEDISLNHTSSDSVPKCLYSCFPPANKLRNPRDIGVFADLLPLQDKIMHLEIVYGAAGWLYFALFVFIEAKFRKRPGTQPGSNKAASSEDEIRPYPSRQRWQPSTTQFGSMKKRSRRYLERGLDRNRYCFRTKVFLRLVLWILSISLLLGFVGFSEMAHLSQLPSSEDFAAVGQWSSIANVVLVFVAVMVRLLFERISPDEEEAEVTLGDQGRREEAGDSAVELVNVRPKVQDV